MSLIIRTFILLALVLSFSSSQAQNWQIMDWGLQNRCNNMCVDTANNLLYVVGYFNNASGLTANRIAVWDGTSWSTLGNGFNGVAFDVEIYQGEVYVVGQFTSPASFIAKWDGSAWVDVGGGLNNIAVELSVINNELHVGGTFTQAGGMTANRIAKWDGTSWSTYGIGFPQTVNEIIEYNGDVIACGQFWGSGSTNADGIMRWDGTQWVDLGGSTNADVFTAYVDEATNELYVGGTFGMAGSTSALRIAKWDGTSWSAVGGGLPDQVNSIHKYDGNLVVGGYFLTAGGVAVNRIASWDGTNWAAFGDGFNNFVTSIDTYNGSLVVGGEFRWTSTFTHFVDHIATWNLPPPIAGYTVSSDTVCNGNTLTFSDTSTGAPNTWNWSFPGGSPSSSTAKNPMVQYDTPGTYDVQLIVGNPEGTDTVMMSNSITVLGNLASYGVSNDTIVCDGVCVNLQASGAAENIWSAMGMNDTASLALTVCPSQTTTYHVELVDPSGCASDSVVVAVNALPSVTIAGTDSICQGESSSLTAAGAMSYSWSTGAVGGSIVEAPTTSTIYNVVGTDGNGCVNNASFSVHVGALPAVTIAGVDTICDGEATTLTATGAASYAWNTGASSNSLTVTPSANTTYSVVGTSVEGCVDSFFYSISVNALPTLSIAGNDTICEGETTTLTASGAVNYNWGSGVVTNPYSVSPATSSVYQVIGTDINGCSDSVVYNVHVNALPVLSINGVDSICEGQSTTLTASGAANYVWSTGAAANSITVNPASAVTYMLTGTSINGCVDSLSYAVYVDAIPTLSIAGTDSICQGDSAVVTVSGAVDYLWSTGETSTTIMTAPNTTVTYSVVGSSLIGCTDSAAYTVHVSMLPAVAITGDTVICEGDSTMLQGSGGVASQWSTGDQTPSIIVAPTATQWYTLTVTSQEGCIASETVEVTVNPLPAIPVISQTGGDLTSSMAVSYQWLDDAMNVVGTNQTFTPTANGQYWVEITDANGCSSISAPYDFQWLSIASLNADNALSVYPNPTDGLLFITLSDETMIENWTVLDRAGRVVLAPEDNDQSTGSIAVDLSGLAAGTYALMVITDGAVHAHKVIVQ